MKKDELNKLQIVQDAFTKEGKVHPRLYHTLGVLEKALELNQIHHLGLSKGQIEDAALFHDIAKLQASNQMLLCLESHYPHLYETLLEYPAIWHAFVGAIVAKEQYGICDPCVLNAILYHTTGRPQMTDLEKLIFISDYVENGRIGIAFEKARKIANQDLDSAIVVILEQTFAYLQKKGELIYPLSQETYHYYVKRGKANV
ncbi:MAG: bis(5'-nucleosyl)-tetraphosphatase (symmetrical) YqeK [Prevotella sp.]|nr:bis(5'-nucleosyl)-tetraphosphatase (symmetrical) YqeK [Staphylococcus sp.]MCM1349970.1 bis(5'-nucleosyl)-tetraphosphatase (symmetrical) YqeK [Prevotella sp.]